MFWRQFKFVVWKNLLVKRRHLSELLLEFLVPTVVVLGLWSIRLAINKDITEESIPNDSFHVESFGDLFMNPVCKEETLLWNCATLDDTSCDVFDHSTNSWEGCLLKKIAVAPASDSDAAQVKAARDFLAFTNSSQMSSPTNSSMSFFTYFESESAFVRHIRQKDYSRDIENIQVYSSAVIFNSGGPQWDYSVRLNKTTAIIFGDSVDALNVPSTEDTTDIFLKSADEWPEGDGIYESAPYLETYHSTGLFSLTNYVNSFIATETCRSSGLCEGSGEVHVLAAGLVNFPNRKIEEDSFWASMGGSFSLLMILALLYPVSNVIKSLVTEKESRLKEGMLMMSLESSVLAASWVFHFVLIFCPLALVLTLAGQGLFLYSSNVFIFLYFLSFFIASMAYSFLVSVLFSRAKSASILGTFVFFMGYFVYVGLDGTSGLTRTDLMLACLHPASAFTYGTLAFQEYEDAQIGLTIDTWTTSSLYEISFADTLLMQLINTLYLCFLTWYLGQVWRSEFGLAKPWYFLFQPSYWRAACNWKEVGTGSLHFTGERVHTHEEGDGVEMTGSGGTSVTGQVRVAAEEEVKGAEKVPVEEVAGHMRQQIEDQECVHLSGLKKVFDTNTGPKVAVDGLDLTFYSGQITALLGHNGAGKSTTVSMLSGLYPPTSGTATIAGFDISTHMHEARKLLGVCPQHDVLLPELTVAEHLKFFAGIKGCPAEEIESEVDRLIKSVGLVEKRDVQSKFLSGGQKRKLSVAIAFIGNSKIVILDEPTSGMDPYSRRFTWNVIRQHREGRVIILVTHFMDEADLLGDRIAIMGDGKLRCCGSSLFLKKKYGVGYNMTLEKKSAVDFDTPAVMNQIYQSVPDATVLTDVGTELTVQLPFASSHSFEALFGSIDAAQTELQIASYGMSVTTMEEVFLKVAAGTDTIHSQATSSAASSEGAMVAKGAREGTLLGGGEGEEAEVEGGGGTPAGKHVGDDSSLFLRHMYILLQKRYIYFSRDTKSWLYQYILPVLFVLIGAIIMSISEFAPDQSSLVVSPDMFNKKISIHDFPLPFASRVCYSEGFCPENLYPHTQAEALMSHVPDALNLPTESLLPPHNNSVSQLANMSHFLLTRREDYEASRYGALSYHDLVPGNSSSWGNSGEGVDSTTLSVITYSVHANFSGLHAGPVTNHLAAEAVVRSLDPSASLTMRLHPLPETLKQEDTFSQWSVTNLVLFVALAISFVPAGMASFVVYEKETKSRHQQMVSGVSIHAYWLSTFVWDSLSYQVTAWLMLIVIVAFPDTDPLTSEEAFPVTVGLLMLYGPAVAGFCYLFSYFLKTSASSQIVVIFVMFVLGLILSIVALVLRFIPSTRDVYMDTIRYFFIIFPPFAVIEGLNNLAVMAQYSAIELGGGRLYSPTDMKIGGLNLLVLGLEAFIFILLQIACDYLLMKPQLLDYVNLQPKKPAPIPGEGRDDDVLEEDRQVASGAINEKNSTVLIKGITKLYPGGKYAVKGVSLGIPMGQCFGLLGINGAGKSSLLNMLSGEFAPTSGDAFISGISLVTDVDKCRKRIGFCPQFDALYDLLTAREHLRFYAAVKGIPSDLLEAAVDVKLKEMGLLEYADRATGGFSGGNKRKLSVAMAMIGDPTIVFLDEPSTGMDPMARRFMWRVISDVVTKREQCSLILTTHSMEECEALCSRIAIMVDGVMRCLGSSQRLRNRYGLGYQIELLMKVPEEDPVAALAADFQATITGAAATAVTATSAELTRSEAEKAMTIVMNKQDWTERFCEHGSGADIHSSFLHNGFVTASHLASWALLEQRYEALVTFLQREFEGFQIRERQGAKVRVEVPLVLQNNSPRKLSGMFGLIEASQQELQLLEYSISQTSLEQIFNSFAMQQTGETL